MVNCFSSCNRKIFLFQSFSLSKSTTQPAVGFAALLIVVEAKKNDFDQGWAQCLAELITAQKLNGDNKLPVYGIVTDGKYWEFGELTDKLFNKNSNSFIIDDLFELFGALNYIFTLAEQNI